jgi:O-glycosyl hydrolase
MRSNNSLSVWSRWAIVTAAVIAFTSGCSLLGSAHQPEGHGTAAPTTGHADTAVPTPGPVTIEPDRPPQPMQVTIDPSRTYQVMQGFGASHRLWEDPHVSNAPRTSIPPAARTEILTRLYKDLGLTRVRLAFDSPKRNDAHLAYVKEAIPFGLETYFPAPIILDSSITERNPDAYVEWALPILLRWRQLGQEPPFFSVYNEPGNSDLRVWSGQWMRTVVKRLGARMRAAGIKTQLVIPDDINPAEAYGRARVILEDAEARPYVGALAYHLYGTSIADQQKMQQLSMTYGIPVWMTEYSNVAFREYRGALKWAWTVHTLISDCGVSAVDYMWGFFGSWDVGHELVAVEFDGGKYKSHAPTWAYYVTGHFSRFVRPGYVRVDARSDDPDVLVSAYTGPDGMVIVAINSGRDPKLATFRLAGGPASGSLSAVMTTRSEPWKTMPPIPAQDGSFSVMLPPESLTTLTGAQKQGQ